ncbi:MAG TPA: excinuclease ABC subunit C, partial [Deltaproteobacteria bacterium]|nr:excinuclease ABC subunit C [Deltaproteobacteria bacterium]
MISSAKIKLEDLPRASGVYLMKNAKGEILYIGKAANLRTRVSSYFSKEEQERFQIRFLVSKVDSIETVITANAKEALLLENTLIKKHRPRYNIDLKDDKSYVSLKLSVRDAFPRLYVTRRLKKDGSLYFGPYASAWACREVTDFIEKYFRLRTCSDHEFRNRVRPCLQYQIHRCDAPCVGYINSEEYAKVVRQVKLFLEGKSDELKKIVTGLMQAAAEREAFEEAKNYRDLLCEMERTFEKQQVVSHHNLSRDVIGLYREGEAAAVVVLGVRGGNLQESRHFHFKSHESDGEILASFLLQYYAEEHFIPAEILLPCEVEDRIALEEIFSERAGRKVELHSPQRGAKFDLVKMAAENAKQAFVSRGLKEKNLEDALADLQRRLGLSQVPQTIECYDISNIQGRESVGSMVTFRGGKPDKHGYRHFKIKGVVGADDFASMYELLSRRLKRVSSGASEWALPELILIDGGKGQ